MASDRHSVALHPHMERMASRRWWSVGPLPNVGKQGPNRCGMWSPCAEFDECMAELTVALLSLGHEHPLFGGVQETTEANNRSAKQKCPKFVNIGPAPSMCRNSNKYCMTS